MKRPSGTGHYPEELVAAWARSAPLIAAPGQGNHDAVLEHNQHIVWALLEHVRSIAPVSMCEHRAGGDGGQPRSPPVDLDQIEVRLASDRYDSFAALLHDLCAILDYACQPQLQAVKREVKLAILNAVHELQGVQGTPVTQLHGGSRPRDRTAHKRFRATAPAHGDGDGDGRMGRGPAPRPFLPSRATARWAAVGDAAWYSALEVLHMRAMHRVRVLEANRRDDLLWLSSHRTAIDQVKVLKQRLVKSTAVSASAEAEGWGAADDPSLWFKQGPMTDELAEVVDRAREVVEQHGGISGHLADELRTKWHLSHEQLDELVQHVLSGEDLVDEDVADDGAATGGTHQPDPEPGVDSALQGRTATTEPATTLSPYPHPSVFTRWPHFVEWFFVFTKLLQGLCLEFALGCERIRAALSPPSFDRLLAVTSQAYQRVQANRRTALGTITMRHAEDAIARYLALCQLMLLHGVTGVQDCNNDLGPVRALFAEVQAMSLSYLVEFGNAPAAAPAATAAAGPGSQVEGVAPVAEPSSERQAPSPAMDGGRAEPTRRDGGVAGESLRFHRKFLEPAFAQARECLLLLFLDNRHQRLIPPVHQATALNQVKANFQAALETARKLRHLLDCGAHGPDATAKFAFPEPMLSLTTYHAGVGFVRWNV